MPLTYRTHTIRQTHDGWLMIDDIANACPDVADAIPDADPSDVRPDAVSCRGLVTAATLAVGSMDPAADAYDFRLWAWSNVMTITPRIATGPLTRLEAALLGVVSRRGSASKTDLIRASQLARKSERDAAVNNLMARGLIAVRRSGDLGRPTSVFTLVTPAPAAEAA